MARTLKARFGVAISVAAMAMTVGAGATFAGEVTGTGRSLEPLHANSICAYSGLNDKTAGEGDVTSRVQSYGQVVRGLKGALKGVPGTDCRGGSL